MAIIGRKFQMPTERPNALIDFHAHVLPGMDHGSSSVAMSLRQLKRARDAGVRTIVATPHFYAHQHHVRTFLAARDEAYSTLIAASRSSLPKLLSGAEVLLCAGIERMDGVERLCVEQTNVLLLEMPSVMNERLYASLYELQASCHLHVVLAHIDRYDTDTVIAALMTGACAQINADAVCSRHRRKRCFEWIQEGVVEALGSDIHRDGSQYRCFAKAVSLLGDLAYELQKHTEELLVPSDDLVQ